MEQAGSVQRAATASWRAFGVHPVFVVTSFVVLGGGLAAVLAGPEWWMRLWGAVMCVAQALQLYVLRRRAPHVVGVARAVGAGGLQVARRGDGAVIDIAVDHGTAITNRYGDAVPADRLVTGARVRVWQRDEGASGARPVASRVAVDGP